MDFVRVFKITVFEIIVCYWTSVTCQYGNAYVGTIDFETHFSGDAFVSSTVTRNVLLTRSESQHLQECIFSVISDNLKG